MARVHGAASPDSSVCAGWLGNIGDGSSGSDKIVTSADLARMVADGELRYVYWGARGGGFRGPGGGGGQSNISSWVTGNCRAAGYDTATQNSGAPDGTGAAGQGNRGAPGRGASLQASLCDCSSLAIRL